MKLAATIAAAVLAAALPAHAESVTLTKTKGDNQKTIVGPQFDSIEVRVTDAGGKPLRGVEVTFSCSRSPSGPCITLPKGPLRTATVEGGVALLDRGDRADGKAFEPGVETIVATAQGASATFKVEFVPDYK